MLSLSNETLFAVHKSVAAGMNPMDLKRGIDKAISTAVQFVEKLSVPCSDDNTIAQVGTISANGDSPFAEMVPTCAMVLSSEHGTLNFSTN